MYIKTERNTVQVIRIDAILYMNDTPQMPIFFVVCRSFQYRLVFFMIRKNSSWFT